MTRRFLLSLIICALIPGLPTYAREHENTPHPKKEKRLKIKEKRVKTRKAALKLLTRKKINEADYDTALLESIKSGELRTATALVLAGATLNRPADQESPLHLAAQYGDADLLRVMLEHGADLNHKITRTQGDLTGTGMNALFSAVLGNNVSTLEHLHQQGLDIHACDSSRPFSQTPMQKAAFAGSLECFEYLHTHGGDIGQRYGNGFSYLHAAANRGHLKLVKYILDQGVDINATNKAEITPIMSAGMGKHADVIRYLADRGADINAQDNYFRRTIMHHVTAMGDAELVEYLTSKGARMDIRDRDGKTAAEIWKQTQNAK